MTQPPNRTYRVTLTAHIHTAGYKAALIETLNKIANDQPGVVVIVEGNGDKWIHNDLTVVRPDPSP